MHERTEKLLKEARFQADEQAATEIELLQAREELKKFRKNDPEFLN